MPFMEDLYETTHETVHLGIPPGTDVIHIKKINGHVHAAPQILPGTRMPMYCTSLGKALLAFSPPELLERVTRRACHDGLHAPSSPLACCAVTGPVCWNRPCLRS